MAATPLELGKLQSGVVEADDTAEYELTISPVDNHIPEISVTVSGFGSGGEVVPSVTATFSSDGGAMLPDAVSSTWPYDTLLLPQFESDDDVTITVELSCPFSTDMNYTVVASEVIQLLDDEYVGTLQNTWSIKQRVNSAERIVFHVIPPGESMSLSISLCGGNLLPFGIAPFVSVGTNLWYDAPRQQFGS